MQPNKFNALKIIENNRIWLFHGPLKIFECDYIYVAIYSKENENIKIRISFADRSKNKVLIILKKK